MRTRVILSHDALPVLLSYARSATVGIVSLLMIALYPVSDSVYHVHHLPRIDLSNIARELVYVPVRI